jgi:hypothetical protein
MQPPGAILPDYGCLPQAEMPKRKGPSKEEISAVMKDLNRRKNEALSPERRSEIARNAARARWAQSKGKRKPPP